ncbi:nucleotide-diphospho-sugar transferase [Cytophagaceae bacterium YF14B1]|uniref:Nucleotide-diphospho-sugar transferase n=1 Tax=Xanthocytophaga flava TaxID=3048013 RepID=A0AAE3QN24_9BACT|nr:nucleotide-diphospho-sugar transferase [Xanthocytophaga flavus]MDJ1480358.1 nucleotide-diphospho-sugar transferase [Xanthocytophaga flavus]
MEYQLKTPIIFIIFNRPDTTEKVFNAIRDAKPKQLLVVADAPRPDRPEDLEKCAATRAIINRVDWDCQVLTNYSEVNLGAGKRPATGFDWAFSIVEEAIILEDDCLPDPSFFRFCEELLERYRYDPRIMCISGQNVQFGQSRTPYSYYFSRYNHGWGWATWRRAWQHFDFQMKLWPEARENNLLASVFENEKGLKNWTDTLQKTYEGQLPAWDYQFTFACWMQNGLSILSDVNLISNIGFGEGASNTMDTHSPYNAAKTYPMTFPLKHPPYLIRNKEADAFTENTLFDYHPSILKRVKRKLQKVLL